MVRKAQADAGADLKPACRATVPRRRGCPRSSRGQLKGVAEEAAFPAKGLSSRRHTSPQPHSVYGCHSAQPPAQHRDLPRVLLGPEGQALPWWNVLECARPLNASETGTGRLGPEGTGRKREHRRGASRVRDWPAGTWFWPPAYETGDEQAARRGPAPGGGSRRAKAQRLAPGGDAAREDGGKFAGLVGRAGWARGGDRRPLEAEAAVT